LFGRAHRPVTETPRRSGHEPAGCPVCRRSRERDQRLSGAVMGVAVRATEASPSSQSSPAISFCRDAFIAVRSMWRDRYCGRHPGCNQAGDVRERRHWASAFQCRSPKGINTAAGTSSFPVARPILARPAFAAMAALRGGAGLSPPPRRGRHSASTRRQSWRSWCGLSTVRRISRCRCPTGASMP
jgi:hypothetical protein